MNFIERFHWWFTGEVAETIEKRYDDTTDAILFPGFSALFSVLCLYSAVEMIANGHPFAILAGAMLAGIGMFCVMLFIVNVAASIRFSREWTQSEPRPEVLDD